MKVGKKYEVIQAGRKGYKNRIVGTVIEEYPSLYSFQTKNYRTNINKSDLACGDYTAKPI
ncbi:hypothetical protein [Senegalia massiliensis]|uniref:Uncharacterized protein n=1 Tax=Senegalia massiliensis TaxID=1720316 RepID=A0A845R0I9_9CLOT|nr:hypothetical protein [Senegalia massiliensis]NBI08215.1 hypothetical protein [Senegalia massiliensis]